MGVVDGQENTWSNIYTQRFFEVQDGTTETNHQLLAYLAVTSREWLNSLDEDVRNQFMIIFTEVSEDYNARSNAINEDSKQSIIENGGVVRALTPDQRDEWVTTMKPVWDMFRADIGADVIDAAIASNKAR
jgi:C4-dicarboxylate-binding protein DctP